MKTKIFILTMMTVFSTASFAHHPAADIVDEETYAMIDELVSDTPHATLDFNDMGSSMDIEVMLPSEDQEAVDTLADDLDTILVESGSDYEINIDEVGNSSVISVNLL